MANVTWSLTHLIDFLHLDDELVWILALQDSCPYHLTLPSILFARSMENGCLKHALSFNKKKTDDNRALSYLFKFLLSGFLSWRSNTQREMDRMTKK